MNSAFAISVRNLSKNYQEGGTEHQVLSGVSVDIKTGETVALLGRSGSGKSTLLNVISGIDSAESGEVEINEKMISAMSDQDRTLFRREHIGFIYQFFNLIPTLTVGENLNLVLELNGTHDAEKRCLELLAAVGLKNRSNSFPDTLSGGEQQRVAIARALVHKPAIILADEPTGNLDETTASEIWSLFDTLIRPMGGTILLATHSLEAAKRCDRIFELLDGTLHDCTARHRE